MTDELDDDATRDEQIQHHLARLERGFQRKWENDADFRESLKGKDRDILIDLTDIGAWTLRVRDGKLEEIERDRPEDPDVSVKTSSDDFIAIFKGELSPVKAFLFRKVKVNAPPGDIKLVKAFMGG